MSHRARTRRSPEAASAPATYEPGYWRAKPIDALSPTEWELLCDGCGKCCLHKLEDEDNGALYYTNVACRLLDPHTCRCSDYARRAAAVPDCIVLTPQVLADPRWLPPTCAYRLLAEGKDLPSWHPLMCGDPEAVHAGAHSARGRVIPETEVDDLEHHLAPWIV